MTCVTGQTSRQNLWPEEKQLYDALRHCAVNSSVSVGSSAPRTRARDLVRDLRQLVGVVAHPGVNGTDTGSAGPCRSSCVIRDLLTDRT